LCRFLPPSATCDSHHFGPLDIFNTRSNFNVALGAEAQGFCLLRP
jgi:hypothetical protein